MKRSPLEAALSRHRIKLLDVLHETARLGERYPPIMRAYLGQEDLPPYALRYLERRGVNAALLAAHQARIVQERGANNR